MRTIDFVIPGDIAALTGGYTYDREVAAALTAMGRQVRVRQIDERLAQPESLARAEHVLETLPEDTLVVIDGLALAPLADILRSASQRLRLCALVHHPAALETGLSANAAARIARRELAALRVMHSIICTSRWTANELVGSGLQRARIKVVEPGVDTAIARAAASGARRKPLPAHRDGLRLICVATLTPRKGHDVLVAALAELTDLRWELECIGSLRRSPGHAAAIESLIARHDLGHRIRLRGEMQPATLAAAYARADLFVLASHLEGYGMVFAEARAAALPIVATRGGAIEETLAQASAVIVEGDSAPALACALRAIMTDPQRWQTLAAAARERRAGVRSWEKAANEFAHALEEASAA